MDREKKNLRVFGYGLGVIALVFGAGGLLRHGWTGWHGLKILCGVFFIVVAAWRWQAFRPAYKGWMAVAHVIGGVVTGILLTVVYFGVFTPTAIVLRLMGKDHLDRRRDPARSTYWHVRAPGDGGHENYRQQY